MIIININKARNIAHTARRVARASEFAPLDIKVNIPSEAVTAETARQVVRDKYSTIQILIDTATTTEEIKGAMQWLQ